MECVASRMRGSVECGPVTAYPLATASATKRGALLRAIASLAGRASASSHNAVRCRSICPLFLPRRSVSRDPTINSGEKPRRLRFLESRRYRSFRFRHFAPHWAQFIRILAKNLLFKIERLY